MAKALFDAYRAVSACSVGEEIIKEGLIPGLEMLLKDADVMGDAAYRKVVSALLSDLQGQLKKRSRSTLGASKETKVEEIKRERTRRSQEVNRDTNNTAKAGEGTVSKPVTPREGEAGADSKAETKDGAQSGETDTGQTPTESVQPDGGEEEKTGAAMLAAGGRLLDKWKTFSFKKDGWSLGVTGEKPKEAASAGK